MTIRIIPPKHLTKDEKTHFVKVAKLLKNLGIYHHADNDTIEQLAVLVTRSRMLNRDVDSCDDPIKAINALNSMAGQISRLSNKLGMDFKSRKANASTSAGRGRPRKGVAQVVDSSEWAKLGVVSIK